MPPDGPEMTGWALVIVMPSKATERPTFSAEPSSPESRIVRTFNVTDLDEGGHEHPDGERGRPRHVEHRPRYERRARGEESGPGEVPRALSDGGRGRDRGRMVHDPGWVEHSSDDLAHLSGDRNAPRVHPASVVVIGALSVLLDLVLAMGWHPRSSPDHLLRLHRLDAMDRDRMTRKQLTRGATICDQWSDRLVPQQTDD